MNIQDAKHLGYIGFALLGAVGLPHESYIILAVLMLVDTLFGVVRVGVVHGGRHIKSYRLTAGILSKLAVLLVPLIIAWAGRGAGIPLTFMATATISVLILAELYSIIGSVYSIWIKEDVQEFDAISFVLRKVQISIEKLLKERIEAHTEAERLALKEKERSDITSNNEKSNDTK